MTRLIARPLLAAVFVQSGIDTLRNPEPRIKTADPVTTKIAQLTGLPDDTELLVKLNAGIQVGAGALLAIGKLPRLAALALAASVVPTTVAGHRFWEEVDETSRHQQQIHFAKNMAILGGLVLAAFDTEGAPSLAWRARRAARKTSERASELASSTREAAASARQALPV